MILSAQGRLCGGSCLDAKLACPYARLRELLLDVIVSTVHTLAIKTSFSTKLFPT